MNRSNLSIALFIILFVLTSVLTSRIVISNTPNTYLPKEMDSRILNDVIRKKFGSDELLLAVFRKESSFTEKDLKVFFNVFKSVNKIKGVKKSTSVFNFELIKSEEDGFEVRNILDIKNISNFKEDLKEDDNVYDFLINKKLDTLTLVIEPEIMGSSIERLNLEKNIHRVIVDNNMIEHFFGFGGQFAIDIAQFKEMLSIMKITIPITTAIGFIILMILFSNIKFVLLSMACNGVIVQFCLGLFTLFKWPYNMVSAMIPSLMIALSTAFMVHLLNSIKRNSNSDCSIKSALKEVRQPSIYSAVTTAIGLFALYTSPIPPIQHIGIIGGLGVLFSYIIIFEIAPYIMVLFKNQKLHGGQRIDTFFRKIVISNTSLVSVHYKKIVIMGLSILILMIPPIYNVKSESNLFKFFSDTHVVNIVNKKFQDEFVGTTSVDIIFEKIEIGNLLDHGFLQYLNDIQLELEEHKEISRAFSHVDIIKRLHGAFSGNTQVQKLPINNELIEQYTMIYDGADLFDFIDRNYTVARLNLSLSVQGANEIEKVLFFINETLSKYNYKFKITGQGKMMSDQEDLLISGVLKSLVLSLVIIFFLLAILWKSPLYAIISMIPNLSPVIAGFCAMGIFGVWLDFGTAMIASITVGIAVDDTIHIFHGIMEKLRSGLDIDSAIKSTYEISGNAIIMTTIILCFQFGLLTMSSFKPLMYFGMLTCTGLLVALIYDLLFLPSLIKLLVTNFPNRFIYKSKS